jgi:hypothetical protein
MDRAWVEREKPMSQIEETALEDGQEEPSRRAFLGIELGPKQAVHVPTEPLAREQLERVVEWALVVASFVLAPTLTVVWAAKLVAWPVLVLIVSLEIAGALGLARLVQKRTPGRPK